MNVFMARQPIYDRRMEVMGYELLYREGKTNSAGPFDNETRARSLINTLVELGLNKLVGNKLAFVNLSRDLILGQYVTALPADRVVIEILEDVAPDRAVTEAVRSLVKRGYTIALDDFVYRPEYTALIKLSKIIKIDVLAHTRPQLQSYVKRLKRPGMKLVAEKVEDRSTFDACQKLGFDLFQGYFFCKPEIVEGRGIAPDRLSVLRLLALLQDPSSSYSEIERLASRDVSLTYRLLKFINSAYTGLPDRVESLRQAMQLLGTQTITALASLVAMSGIGGKPQELMEIAMIRAKTCENLAQAANLASAERFFTVGLLSVLDALLDSPMATILTELPLSEDVNHALLNRADKGDLASALRCAVAIERGYFDKAVFAELAQEQVSSAYIRATDWSREVTSTLAA